MDLSRNVTLSGGLPSEYEPEQLFSPSFSRLGSLDDLFSCNNTEGDMNLEWLSIFVEDCLSSSGNCLPPVAILPPQIAQNKTNISTASKIIPKAEPSKPLKLVKSQKSQSSSSSSVLQKFVIPGKARSKRKRGPIGNKAQRSIWGHRLQMSGSDPPLLQQAHWLADSELILPKNEENNNKSNNRGIIRARNEEMKEEANNDEIMKKEEGRTGSLEGSNGQQPRRCSHCLAQRTPQWRAGPLGPKTLCNACGVRYKSGRLLPEYRPAKSPTFVSYKHSNSHKKVLEMRTTSSLPSNSY